MRALVSGLLDLARSDQAKTAAARERFDWSRCALDACLPFEPVFFERGLTFSYDVEPGLFVLGDEAQLKRCANILLDNAQKYAAPGGACSLRLMRHGKNRCRLCISSEGAPLSAEACRKIFERFYRLDGARSRDGSYGLGAGSGQRVQRMKTAFSSSSRSAKARPPRPDVQLLRQRAAFCRIARRART